MLCWVRLVVEQGAIDLTSSCSDEDSDDDDGGSAYVPSQGSNSDSEGSHHVDTRNDDDSSSDSEDSPGDSTGDNQQGRLVKLLKAATSQAASRVLQDEAASAHGHEASLANMDSTYQVRSAVWDTSPCPVPLTVSVLRGVSALWWPCTAARHHGPS